MREARALLGGARMQWLSAIGAARRAVVKGIGSRLVFAIESPLAARSPLGDRPFFDPSAFPWVPGLEAAYPEIRRELAALLVHFERLPGIEELSKDQRSVSTDGLWKTYWLYAYGTKSEGNCARCPATTRAIEGVPGMVTACFSILAPGKRLPPHRGPYKGVLRYHLGLVVPEPREASALVVAGETRHWEEGKSLVFDDTFMHEAWNGTDAVRGVLFLDVLRPLPEPYDTLNRAVVGLVSASHYIRDAAKRNAAWSRAFDAYLARPAPA
jgi:beta-hydroxylase